MFNSRNRVVKRFLYRNSLVLWSLVLLGGPTRESFAGPQGDPYFGDVHYAATGESDLQVLHVTTDTDIKNPNAFTDIKVRLNRDGEFVGVRQISEVGEVKDFSLHDLKEGALLREEENRKVLVLKGDLDPKGGGKLGLIYLSNGIVRSYGTFSMELYREGNSWKLRKNDRSGRTDFQYMFVGGQWIYDPFNGGWRVIGVKKINVATHELGPKG